MSKLIAFTVVELLVCVAIVVTIASLLLSVLGNSKREALLTEDVAKLPQLGAAAQLYESDHDGMHPLSVQPLTRTSRADPVLVQSALDPTKEGWLNLLVLTMSKSNPNYTRRRPSTRISFVGVGDLFRGSAGAELRSSIASSEDSSGWLIAFSLNKVAHVERPREMLSGAYLRLTFAGAVLRRNSAEREGELAYQDLFRDFKE